MKLGSIEAHQLSVDLDESIISGLLQQSQQPSASSLLSGSPPHSGRTSPPSDQNTVSSGICEQLQSELSSVFTIRWFYFSIKSHSRICNSININNNRSSSNSSNPNKQFNYKRSMNQWNYNWNIGLSKDPSIRIKANRKVLIRANAVSKEHFEVYRYASFCFTFVISIQQMKWIFKKFKWRNCRCVVCHWIHNPVKFLKGLS